MNWQMATDVTGARADILTESAFEQYIHKVLVRCNGFRSKQAGSGVQQL